MESSHSRPSGLSRRSLVVGGTQLVGLAALGRLTAVPASAAPASAAPVPLQTFDFDGVRLLDSRWQVQQDTVTDYYVSVPTDDYLKGFRLRAGLDAPGEELGGAYTDGVFHPFGQYVSGLARLYAGSGREDVRAKVEQLVIGFGECIDDDGYFFYTDSPQTAHYVYDKMLCGLLDAWQYCGIERARVAMDRITDWALDPQNLGRTRPYRGGAEAEWYTLSENLYRAFLATGDARYRDFAEVWEYRGFWDRFYHQQDFFQTPDGEPVADYHAYSHVNSLSGLGAGYAVTGDAYYLTTLRQAYDTLRDTQCWATGGYGPFEHLLPTRDALAGTLEPLDNHFETQCGSWAVLKVCKYLLTHTGEARFGDWSEQMLYNGVGATAQPMSDDGMVQYHTRHSPRGSRKINIGPWSCCTGTRPQAVADYADLVFLRSDDRLLVNLFLPARASWQSPAGTVTARVDTGFPDTDVVALVLEDAPAGPFTLGFRAPEWLADNPVATVNGQGVPAVIDDSGWITIRREWQAGDRLEVTLPMDLRQEPFLDEAYPTAVAYGPVALAFATESNPVEGLPPEQADTITRRMHRGRRDGLRWTFRQQGGRTVDVRPFYDLELEERYFLYLDSDAGPYFELHGSWGSFSWLTGTNVEGDFALCEFDGPALRWSHITMAGGGIARVEIDGEFVRDVDQYSAESVWTSTDFTGLSEGPHVIRIVNTGRRNPDSSGTQINILDLAYPV